ncbi:hypothetical protein OC846_003419 [Tilletia horrida]|uniref:Uncharacterized protein n=1 Tax=Tilletia horrida TaxID=155126 RepID=A0AAN6GSI8_9BASI|nr:hypothetical protein OC846_003419 [Tilletia horrida]KAK0568908.1 hypothetical protein OC861_001435 [Tilletia horrida]
MLSMRDVDEMRATRARAQADAAAKLEQQQQQQQQVANGKQPEGRGPSESQHRYQVTSTSQTNPETASSLHAGAGEERSQVSAVPETQLGWGGSSQFPSQGTTSVPASSHHNTQDWIQAGGSGSSAGGASGSQAEPRREAIERERRAMPANQRILGP